ncbi:acyl-CoA dehydrogenase [Halieaceae bacterium IMCC14734]|uniref:Acyl-CoA dehydrogenase n=1 Tax=Candidatus Litorirhabdus singularis TaxID=2518993 RepID=A0ABT3TLQ8_9GAMM|nr:acyl-CoA/acyl-ACP dehydrogenase [Candidatus Litorirhabdus singularis]MCX2983230.1 acyl-CoA dehydrogenase [Candidatus Litorirhabdus singularis]
MDFTFTEEQLMIRDTAEAFLAEVSTSAAVRAAMATELGYDAELWQKICDEMFWQAIHIPEEYGGMGLGYVELVAMLEQMGRYLLCSPFYSTVCLGVNSLLIAGTPEQKAEYLPRIIEGATATLAYTGSNGRWDAEAVTATYVRSGDEYVLNGSWRYVPDGHSAQLLVVAAREEGSSGTSGITLFIVPADSQGITREWLPTMDQTRKQAQIVMADAVMAPESVMNEPGNAWQLLERIIGLATVAVAAEQVGGAQQALDITVAYTQERVQFGRVIAGYQAIKHKAADMMVKVEAGRSAAYYAACVADETLRGGSLASELGDAASVAKAWCSDAFFFNAGCGIQLHGGVGFTWEYDIQLYFKRAKSSETFLGTGAWHRDSIAASLLD